VNHRLQRVTWWTRQGLLTGGALLGFVCMLVAIGSAIFGLRPLVFQSGSMSPAIETGALGIAHEVPASSLAPGDVVSVPTAGGERVTHRIVTVAMDGDDIAELELRGDANTASDADTYRVTHADRVLFDVPRLGYAVAWLAGPVGLFLLGLYAAFLLAVLFKRSPEPPRPTPPSAGGPSQRGVVTTGLTVLLLAGLGGGAAASHRVTPTEAAWTDDAKVDGTSLTAYTVPAPGLGSCALVTPGSNTSRGIRLDWPANVAPKPLLSHATTVTTANGSALAGESSTITEAAGVKSLTVLYNPGTAVNQNQMVTVTVGAHPVGSAAWLSPAASWKFRTGATAGTQPTCGETTPPTVGIVGPADGSTMTRAAAISAACWGLGRPACGTRGDESAYASTEFRFERTIGGATTCWDTSWTTGNCTTSWRDTQIFGNYWLLTGTAANAYQLAGVYKLTVRVTDVWGNYTDETITFTLT
jgi:signal peptidase I